MQRGDSGLAETLRRRRRERGASAFIVTLVVAVLSGMGIFAAKAAGVTEAVAGYDRLNEQTHYVMEEGVLLAAAEIGRSPAVYTSPTLTQGNVSGCYSLPGLPTTYPCSKFTYTTLSSGVNIAQTNGGQPSVAPITPAVGLPTTPDANTPGSLGPIPLNPDFYVEMTDIGPVGRPPAGSPVGGGGNAFAYLEVTLSGWGQISPYRDTTSNPSNTLTNDQAASLVSSREQGQAHVIIGPVPKQ